jgi:FkbM family methyltransferase
MRRTPREVLALRPLQDEDLTMAIWPHVLRNIQDAVHFGPLFLLRHLAHLLHRTSVRLPVRGLGSIVVRPGNSDAATFHQIFIDRPYDLARFRHNSRVTQTYRDIIERGHTPLIIDAGANVGAASLWFARCFPMATIIAIEPDAGSAAICRLNVARTANVIVVEAAIGGAPGFVDLNRTALGWETQSVRSIEGLTPILTIEDALRRGPAACELFLVKVDIEGFEKDLFAGDIGWVARTPVVMIEPHDWMLPGQHTSHRVIAAFARTDHELLIADDTLVFVQ